MCISCQSQFNPYEEFQFKDIIFCKGLDEKGLPIKVDKKIISRAKAIHSCILVETDKEFFFSVDLFGPISLDRKVIKAKKSGWVIASFTNGGNEFPVGEYWFDIRILKTRKATKAFEIIRSEEPSSH